MGRALYIMGVKLVQLLNVGGDNTRIPGLTSGIMSVFLSSSLYVFKMA